MDKPLEEEAERPEGVVDMHQVVEAERPEEVVDKHQVVEAERPEGVVDTHQVGAGMHREDRLQEEEDKPLVGQEEDKHQVADMHREEDKRPEEEEDKHQVAGMHREEDKHQVVVVGRHQVRLCAGQGRCRWH